MRRSTTAADPSGALSAAEFAAALEPFEPFETSPSIAVAVSGGADSLALLLLADGWVRARGGRVIGLTVDHGLRAHSAEEARLVGEWLAHKSIEHVILRWDGPRPTGDIQAAAREARYRLLGQWCRDHGILHLLTAHHRDDQVETVLLRLERGSGLAGLAGMAAVTELPHLRVLRVLLCVPAARLRATLGSAGQDWVEDPSNRDTRYARSRVRTALTAVGAAGGARLAGTAGHLGRARIAVETQVERLLARAVEIDPAGVALIEPADFLDAPEEIRLRGLASLLATIGGAVYPPRFERLATLEATLEAGGPGEGRTLGGCRIVAWRGRWLVCREARHLQPPVPVAPAGETVWDGRFRVRAVAGDAMPRGVSVGALGARGMIELRAIAADLPAPHVPRRTWASLPALWQEARLAAVPHLGWWGSCRPEWLTVGFRPHRALCDAGFAASGSERQRR